MENLVAIWTWITSNMGQIVTIISYIIAIASIIVKLTPTPKDDNALKAIVTFLSKYIALNKPVE